MLELSPRQPLSTFRLSSKAKTGQPKNVRSGQPKNVQPADFSYSETEDQTNPPKNRRRLGDFFAAHVTRLGLPLARHHGGLSSTGVGLCLTSADFTDTVGQKEASAQKNVPQNGP